MEVIVGEAGLLPGPNGVGARLEISCLVCWFRWSNVDNEREGSEGGAGIVWLGL